MVWNERGSRPKVRHTTLEAAVAESERLSAENEYCAFFVFEIIHKSGPKLQRPPGWKEPAPDDVEKQKATKEPVESTKVKSHKEDTKKRSLTIAEVRQQKSQK